MLGQTSRCADLLDPRPPLSTAVSDRPSIAVRFAPHTFGWKAGKKAAGEVRAEADRIKRLAREDRPQAVEEALALIEHLWPATMQVNRAHGDLDPAVERAVELLVPVLERHFTEAPEARAEALARIWHALEADHGGVTDPLAARFGALCGSAAVAGPWADRLLAITRRAYAAHPKRRCAAALPCASALVMAERPDVLLALLTVGAPATFALRRFALDRLAVRDGLDAALAFADAAECVSDAERQARAAWGEARLRAADRADEAFERYALWAHHGHTIRQWFEGLCVAWPDRAPVDLFEALLAAHPGEGGKFFATARALGDLGRATRLAEENPCDPKVLLHAAADVIGENPALAGRWAVAALGWMADGRVYKVTRELVVEAADLITRAGLAVGDPASARGQLEQAATRSRAAATRAWIVAFLAGDFQ